MSNRHETTHLDPFFAIAAWIGLAPEVLGFEGILSEAWIVGERLPSGADEWFNLMVFLFGIVIIAGSWHGFRKSGSRNGEQRARAEGPQTDEPLPLMAPVRTLLNVLLIPLYGLLLMNFSSFKMVLSIVFLIYSLYVVWDLTVVIDEEVDGGEGNDDGREGNESWLKAYPRRVATLIWGGIVIITCLSYLLSPLDIWDTHVARWPTATLLILATTSYRGHKIWLERRADAAGR